MLLVMAEHFASCDRQDFIFPESPGFVENPFSLFGNREVVKNGDQITAGIKDTHVGIGTFEESV